MLNDQSWYFLLVPTLFSLEMLNFWFSLYPSTWLGSIGQLQQHQHIPSLRSKESSIKDGLLDAARWWWSFTAEPRVKVWCLTHSGCWLHPGKFCCFASVTVFGKYLNGWKQTCNGRHLKQDADMSNFKLLQILPWYYHCILWFFLQIYFCKQALNNWKYTFWEEPT